MQISVILPSYNSEAQLPRTLASLSAQEFDGQFEIWVVDCSSGDKVERIVSEHPRAKFRYEAARFNPGHGRNLGAESAAGQLLVFLDTDVRLQKDALTEAWKHYQRGNKIFGGALELALDAHPTVASYLEHFFFNHESQKGRPECRRRNLSSALMLFDRQLFLESGGFKDIPRMQDTELTERLLREGQALTFCPRVVGYQVQDSPLGKVFKKILINGMNLYYIRYRDLPAAKKAAFFLLLPLISATKTARIIGRHLRYQDAGGKWKVLGLSPLLMAAGGSWMAGFYQSLLFGGGISASRD